MTGLETWIRMGLVLGVDWILDLANEIQLEMIEENGGEIPAGTHNVGMFSPGNLGLDRADLVARVASAVMDKWAPWKKQFLSQGELVLDDQVLGECDGCNGTYNIKNLKTTPKGILCIECLAEYVRGDRNA